ncbi:MAG TPA: hypothetical protein VGQ03_06320 [Nitrososphaera sp.]|nr:hypothetical protein [Nitrososphaera sp.]
MIVLSPLGYIIVKAAAFDYAKVDPRVHASSMEDRYDADQINIKRSVDAALSDFKTKLFLAHYDSDELFAFVHYYEAEELANRPENFKYSFLPDSSDAIGVWFYSDGGVPEHVLVVYLEPVTYRVYGAVNEVD